MEARSAIRSVIPDAVCVGHKTLPSGSLHPFLLFISIVLATLPWLKMKKAHTEMINCPILSAGLLERWAMHLLLQLEDQCSNSL